MLELEKPLLVEAESQVPENDPFPRPEPARPRMHLDYLDGLRAIAALYVMVGHARLQIWSDVPGASPPGGLSGMIYKLTSFGHYAVSLFIVISGFCLMLPVVRNDNMLRGGARDFFKRRARRILPPYYFAMGLSLVLIYTLIGHKTGTHWDCTLPVTAGGLLGHLLLIQDVYGAPQINHVFWSIAVEWQIYFLFPLLVLLWPRQGGARIAIASTIAGYILYRIISRFGDFEIAPQYIGLFALGMLGAAICYSSDVKYTRWRDRNFWLPLCILSSIAAWLLIRRHQNALADLPAGLASLSILVLASRPGPNSLNRLLSLKPLVFVGGFAYSVYLIHAPLLQVAWQYGIRPLRLSGIPAFAALSLIGGSLIVCSAYLFYLKCERPFINTRR